MISQLLKMGTDVVQRDARRFAVQIGVLSFALVCGVIAAATLVSLMFDLAVIEFGPMGAKLAMAAAFGFLGLSGLLIANLRKRRRTSMTNDQSVDVNGQAGSLQAVAQIAGKQLGEKTSPTMVLAIAFVAGFVLSRH